MWSVESNLHPEHLKLSLPPDNRFPWNPWSTVFSSAAENDKNRHFFNPWTSEVFQDFRSNENRQMWTPRTEVSHQETRNNGSRQKPQLFKESKDISPVVENNLNRMQSKSESFVSDETMILQNIFNENLLKKYQNTGTNKAFFPRRNNRKNRRRNRTLKMVANNANSFHELHKHEHKNWNHVPVMNWSQTNLSSRPLENNLYNPFRSISFNKRCVKTRQFQNSTHGKFANDSSSFSRSKVTRKVVPRDNFESCKLSDNSKNDMGNAAPHSSSNLNCKNYYYKPIADNSNKSTIMERKRNPIISSINLKSTTKTHESSNEDITYLFTIDRSSEAKMVPEVDLHSNEMNLVPNKSSKKTDNLNQKKDANDGQLVTIPEKSELTESQTSRKRRLFNTTDKSSKRPSYQPKCMACNMCYDDIISKSETMFISSQCSHTFCRPCISKPENAKFCPACGVKFSQLHRLYL